jgi:hypothetical protein
MKSFIMCTLQKMLLGVIKSRRMKFGGSYAKREDMRNTYRISARNLEQMTALG